MSVAILSCGKEKAPESKRVIAEQAPVELQYSNVALMAGSDFGSFYQILHKTGQHEVGMLSFTSAETIEKFGEDSLIAFFKNMQFSYPLKLRAIKDSMDYKILFYKTSIHATEKTIQIVVHVENDSAKIVLNSLNTAKPFVGI